MSIQDPSDYKTGDAVPSNKAMDLNDNAKVFDVFQNAKIPFVKSRLGFEIPTIYGVISGFNNKINSQFIYKNGGVWADAPDQITDDYKLTYWTIIRSDGQEEGYAVKGSVTLPIAKPASPVNDDNWFLVTSVNLTQMRNEIFNAAGYSYQGEWLPNIQIPAKADRVDNYALWEPEKGEIIVPRSDNAFTTGETYNPKNWWTSEQKNWQSLGLAKGWDVKGDGVTDDTKAIQEALNSTGNIYFHDGTYIIDTDTGLSVPSDTFLIGAVDVTFKATASSDTHYELVNFKDISNSGIKGINIIGDRKIHTGSTGEWGMGIQIYDSSDIYIERVKVSDCWGDGIYLGSTSDASQNKNNTNIHIEDVTLYNNRRQGISVISVNGLWVTNSTIQSTNGTPPAAGIDFEPNSEHHTLKNIFVDNLQSWNNESSAILIVTGNLGNQEISITLDNITSQSDNCLLEIHSPAPLLSGFISLSNSTAKNTTTRGGVIISDWNSDCIFTIDNIKFQNLNTELGQPTNVRCAVNLRVIDDTLPRYRNVNISNIKVDNTGTGNSPYDIYLEGAERGLEDCSISNVNWERTTNIHLVDVNTNFLDISESSLRLGSPFWQGSTGTQNLDVISHHNYRVGSDGNSKHIELILPDLSANLVTTARYKFRDLASITGDYDLMIVAPNGQVVRPTNSRKAGIRYTERTHTGNSFDFQCVLGVWTITGSTAKIGTK